MFERLDRWRRTLPRISQHVINEGKTDCWESEQLIRCTLSPRFIAVTMLVMYSPSSHSPYSHATAVTRLLLGMASLSLIKTQLRVLRYPSDVTHILFPSTTMMAVCD